MCTYGNILLSITTALTKQHKKQQVDYVNVNEWIDHKLFLCKLNSKSCSLHNRKHVVASATYKYIADTYGTACPTSRHNRHMMFKQQTTYHPCGQSELKQKHTMKTV
jgi:hypothetical protein